MFRRQLGDGDAARLLAGVFEPDDARPGYEEVAQPVRSERSSITMAGARLRRDPPECITSSTGRVTVDGKQFAVDRERFPFRGVTYGTFKPRASDGANFPERSQMKLDLAAMSGAGFTVVRTYTEPPDDLLDLAADWGLRVLAGIFYPDWRYLVGDSWRDRRAVARQARLEVRDAARRLAGRDPVLALCLGNEVPADVVRWIGTDVIAGVIEDLADIVHDADPQQLVTYANYPTAGYLPLDTLDFLTFNVFLERKIDFRRYLNRLHLLAGDRPLVLGEMGVHSGTTPEGEQRQAQMLDWQYETAIERGIAGMCAYSWTDEWWVGDAPVVGWNFGLTREDRSAKPALDVVSKWNALDVRDLFDERWPSISVVICAYNAAATLDECLRHTCALDYPELDIIVVDDGSADETAAIAERHPRVQLATIAHAGLAVARNEGYRVASRKIVAYLDSDAYPSQEWPYLLALGFYSPSVGGVGGPNIPPAADGVGAEQVAQAPGGPVHVLFSDDRAEHIPGCNMAFLREVLVETGGFDPVYEAAGDDVDFCWRVLDRGWDIAFHPAALVWHHRRTGLKTYLKQQRGYGRAEALVEARHPDRFTPSGTARWKGRIYNSAVPSIARPRIYRGLYGTAAYQSVYQGGGYALDLAHQVGVPASLVLLVSLPFVLVSPVLGVPALGALVFLGTLFAIDVRGAKPPPGVGLQFRVGVAMMHLLQPLVRSWGRWRHRALARQGLPPREPLPGPVRDIGHGALLLPETRPRAEIAAALVADLRQAGLRAIPANGWEDYDVRLLGSTFVVGDLVTSSHPIGSVQLKVRRRPRLFALCSVALVIALVAMINVVPAAVLGTAAVIDVARGAWRTGPGVRRVVRRAIV
jgi:glycosyltransferase involved in cell wall biosynthesis